MSPDPSPCERVWSEDKNSAADKTLGSKKATHSDSVNNYYTTNHIIIADSKMRLWVNRGTNNADAAVQIVDIVTQ